MRGSAPLSNFDGVKMRGTWTLTIWDENDSRPRVNVFNGWGLTDKDRRSRWWDSDGEETQTPG